MSDTSPEPDATIPVPLGERVFNILIADDDLDDQQLLKDALQDAKVNIRTFPFYDGVQLMDFLLGRSRYRQNKIVPDLILLDLNMPLMDGFQALQEIRNCPQTRSIPVFVITTSTSKEDQSKALELGANGFYSKGASSKEIKRIIKEVCFECFG